MKQKSKPLQSFLGRIRLYHFILLALTIILFVFFSGCSGKGDKIISPADSTAVIQAPLTGNSGTFSANCYQLTIGPTTLSTWANDNGSYSKITFDPYVSTPSMQLDINSYLDCRLLPKPNASDMPVYAPGITIPAVGTPLTLKYKGTNISIGNMDMKVKDFKELVGNSIPPVGSIFLFVPGIDSTDSKYHLNLTVYYYESGLHQPFVQDSLSNAEYLAHIESLATTNKPINPSPPSLP
jgi:hypothetical protein